ncbi:MAG: 16S rRNA (uracil(1498)-N(3))-methyltransferase [Malacoplasma sp.]|nr:16S rRNA (uracil(1498)-N(3))-methyltransferase [Malacoplasma sp.]MDE7112354.1 16S rRNA (uracil(1498)-N(3))-methyltransferase [Malacoplasma sp.]
MRQFSIQIKNNKVWFSDSDLKHLQVLRIKPNQKIKCIDQYNNLVTVEILHLNPIKTRIINIISNSSFNYPYDITCFLGIIKKHNFELAVQKLNELNIKKIVPVYFNYSQKNYTLNFERLEKIISESKKQCNRKSDLIITNPIVFNDLINELGNYENNFLAYEKQKYSEWDKIKQDTNRSLNKISFIVGPEGGFSEKEIIELQKKCLSLKLTNTILKSETAVIYLASILIERFFCEK